MRDRDSGGAMLPLQEGGERGQQGRLLAALGWGAAARSGPAAQPEVAASPAQPARRTLLAGVIGEPRVLSLCARIVGNARLPTVPPGEARGLPIGNLTSQFWANVYLDPLDRFVRDDLGFASYSRYMDDLLLFADDKAELWDTLGELRSFAADRLHLRLKAQATVVAPTSEGISYLGWRVAGRRAGRGLQARTTTTVTPSCSSSSS